MALLLSPYSFSQVRPNSRYEGIARPPSQLRIFAPYLDVDSVEQHLSELARASGATHFVLSFLTSGRHGCQLRWGGSVPLARDHSIARQIIELRDAGGDVSIAFGGEIGKELAQACKDPALLQEEYQEVIDKYGVRRLDFDIEAGGIKDAAAINRRNIVLRRLQIANPDLAISFTLAVSPDGLLPEGVALLKNAEQHGVKIDLVNIMAMNYGESARSKNMGQNAITATKNTTQQLKSIGLKDVGLGVTVMIGRNNLRPEIFTLADARVLTAFVRVHPEIRLLSIWSVGRDRSCRGGARLISPACSGVPQEPFEFTHILQRF